MKTQLMQRAAYGSLMAFAAMSPSDAGSSGEFSLADLADLDVSDIAELRFENNPAGVYEFKVVEADLNEGTNKDGDKRFAAVFKMEIVECVAVLKAGVDKESLVGKPQTENFYISPGADPQKTQEAIGRIRAFVSDIGMDSAGKLGDIVRNTKGHIFRAKIVVQSKDGVDYSRIRFDSAKK